MCVGSNISQGHCVGCSLASYFTLTVPCVHCGSILMLVQILFSFVSGYGNV